MHLLRLLLPAFLLLSQPAFAQSNDLEKKLERASEIARKDGLDKADDYLVKLLKKNPDFGAGWDLLANIRYREYENSKSLDGAFGKITMEVKNNDGTVTKADQDSLTAQLQELLTEVRPSRIAYDKLIYTLRKGTLLAPYDAGRCSFYLRNLMVDIEIDSAVGRKALRYYNDAEEQFSKRNYSSAAKLYQRALEEEPAFYKARMYLGDSYYATENYAEAARIFAEAVSKFPFLLEPRKYLTDAYAKQHQYEKAAQEAIAALAVYPDAAMFSKLEDAAYLADKKVEIKGTTRGAFPARGTSPARGIPSARGTLPARDTAARSAGYRYKDEEDPVKPAGPWTLYEKAGQELAAGYDSTGLAKAGATGSWRYLDVACWEAMLKGSNDPSLAGARRAQEKGYLDCYALVTCFHYDVYPQYLDFAAKNRAKIIRYYTEALKDK